MNPIHMNMKQPHSRWSLPLCFGAAALATFAIPVHAGEYFNDFNGTNPFSPSLPDDERLRLFVTLFDDAASGHNTAHPSYPGWYSTGGVPVGEEEDSGFLKLNDPTNGTRSIIVFPDFEEGFAVSGFTFSVDCRIGAGTTDPADGFSISFARSGNPLITTGDGGWIGGNHENGANSGIAIGFDAYGGDRGIRVSVDGSTVIQHNFVNGGGGGLLTDPLIMQTGPRIGGNEIPLEERIAALGWAEAKVELLPNEDPEAEFSHILNVWWKGVNVIANHGLDYSPSPGRLVFGARTGGQNQAHHFDNVSLETIAFPQAVLSRATVSHDEGFVFQITDFAPDSIVDPDDIEYMIIGEDFLTPGDPGFTIGKVGDVTTITYVPADPLKPLDPVGYYIQFLDGNSAGLVFFDGTVTTPVFPLDSFIAEEPTLNLWNIREIRGATPGSLSSALAIALNPPSTTPPDEETPAPGVIVDYTSPFFNLSDDVGGERGFFRRDALYRTNTVGVDDQNIVFLGKTKIEVAESGYYTFWVRSDDGFALRINGAEFEDVGGIGVNANGFIDPSDSSTIAFSIGTGNSNTRGLVFLEQGEEYVIDFLWWEGTGGSYAEVSWAPGSHLADHATGRWTLVGGAGETPFFPAEPLDLPSAPPGVWSVRNYHGPGLVGNVGSLRAAFDAIANYSGEDENIITTDAETPVVNFQDPGEPNVGSDGLFSNNIPFPLVTDPQVGNNHFVTAARIEIPDVQPGDYSFAVTGDDGVAFRVLGGDARLINSGGAETRSGPAPESLINSGIDSLDSRAFVNTHNSGTPSIGVYRITQAGTYTIEVVHVEQTGDAALEVAWVPGNFTSRNSTGNWELLGDPDHPSVPPLVPVMQDAWFASLPPATDGNWSTAFYYARNPGQDPPLVLVDSLGKINDVLAHPSITPVYEQAPALNYFNRLPADVLTGSGLFRYYTSESPPAVAAYNQVDSFFPGIAATNLIDDSVTLATARVVIPTSGDWTFGVNADDGFALRVVGAPNGFTRISGTADARIDLAQRNAIYRTGGTASVRGVINLPAGEYDIEFAFYERGGGAAFEVFAAQGNFTNEGDSTAWRIVGHTGSGGLALIEQPTDPGPGGEGPPVITSPVFDASTGEFSFSWNSEEGVDYVIEYSADLVTWYEIESAYPGAAGESNYTVNVEEDLTEIDDTEKVFFRLREAD